MTPVPVQYHRAYSNFFLFPYLELFFLTMRKLASVILNIFTYLANPLFVASFPSLHTPQLDTLLTLPWHLQCATFLVHDLSSTPP